MSASTLPPSASRTISHRASLPARATRPKPGRRGHTVSEERTPNDQGRLCPLMPLAGGTIADLFGTALGRIRSRLRRWHRISEEHLEDVAQDAALRLVRTLSRMQVASLDHFYGLANRNAQYAAEGFR